MRRRYIVGVVTVIVVGATASVALSQSGGNGDPAAPNPVSSEVDQRLTGHLAVFRRAAEARDALRGVNAVGHGDITRGGANPSLARLVGEDERFKLYAVPGADSLCEVLQSEGLGAGSVCVTVTEAIETGEAVTTGAAGSGTDRMVYGIAPDGFDSVRFTSPSGEVTSAAIKDDGYIARVPAGTTKAVLVGDARTRPIVIANPPVDAAEVEDR
jgi:hypothetical protein